MTILCIDDDAEDLEVFCDAVKEVDGTAACIGAPSGQEAIDILESGLLPDLIFLDINMPVSGGIETLTRIRKDDRFQAVPVIMYSTTMDPREIDRCKAEGANDFLIKPSQFRVLCEALTTIMRMSDGASK